MCTVPLDFERKLEQRWAARFARQAQSTPEGHKPEKAKARVITMPPLDDEGTRMPQP